MSRRRKLNNNPMYRAPVLHNHDFSALEDEACAPGSDRALFDRYIAYLEYRYDQTGNPCFVWKAISCLYDRAVDDYRVAAAGSAEGLMELSRDEQVTIRNQAERHLREINLSLPPWCVSYLVQAAGTISAIAFGLDYSNAPTNYRDDYLAAFTEWSKRPTLTREQAAQRLSSIFGFTKRGKNAFDELQTERFNLNLEQQFRYKTMFGAQPSRVYEAMAKVLRLDERAVQRRIAHARKVIDDLRRYLADEVDKPPR